MSHRSEPVAADAGSRAEVRTAGFTLLEVVVALMIFALTFGVLAQIIQTGLRQSAVAEAMTTATLIARSQLARVGADLPLEEGIIEGETEDAYRWQTLIRPADVGTLNDDTAPYQVEVTVTWGALGAERSITLTSLRLGPQP
jgi:general secretion pathway protein I